MIDMEITHLSMTKMIPLLPPKLLWGLHFPATTFLLRNQYHQEKDKEIEHTSPSFLQWTDIDLKQREVEEKLNDSFGKGKICSCINVHSRSNPDTTQSPMKCPSVPSNVQGINMSTRTKEVRKAREEEVEPSGVNPGIQSCQVSADLKKGHSQSTTKIDAENIVEGVDKSESYDCQRRHNNDERNMFKENSINQLQQLGNQLVRKIQEAKEAKKFFNTMLQTCELFYLHNRVMKEIKDSIKNLLGNNAAEDSHCVDETARYDPASKHVHKEKQQNISQQATSEGLDEREHLLQKWIMHPNVKDNLILIEWKNQSCILSDIQSLCPGVDITQQIINVWSNILNYKEKLNSDGKFLRFFCPISVTVFFPINANHHYYVICFDLRTGYWDIIDNMKPVSNILTSYGRYPDTLKNHFVNYLRTKNHTIADEIDDSNPIRLTMPWRTTSNFIDCGVFVMNHMETYKGGGTRNWKCILANEGDQQQKQLDHLRFRYLKEIVDFELNSRKNYLQESIKDFEIEEMF